MLRRALLFGILLLAGLWLVRWLQPANQSLEYLRIGIDEKRMPVLLGIEVRNRTKSPITIIDCEADLYWKALVMGDCSSVDTSDRFEYETPLLHNRSVEVPPLSTALVTVEFRWLLAESAPTSLAACQIVPILKTTDSSLVTESVAFILVHEGLAESTKTGGLHLDASHDSVREFLESASSIEGKRSKLFRQLIENIQGQLEATPEGEAKEGIDQFLRRTNYRHKSHMKHGLSPRQSEVMRLVSLGCGRQEIAAVLGISVKSVDTYRYTSMKVLGSSKAALVTRLAIKHGITTLDDQLTAAEKRKSGRTGDGWN